METKVSLGKMPLCFGRPVWWLPSMSWNSSTGPGLLGMPYSPIGQKSLATLEEKIFKAFAFLVLLEMEAWWGLKAPLFRGNDCLMHLAVQEMKPQAESGMGHEAPFVQGQWLHGGWGWLERLYHSIKGGDHGGFVWELGVNPSNLAAIWGLGKGAHKEAPGNIWAVTWLLKHWQ